MFCNEPVKHLIRDVYRLYRHFTYGNRDCYRLAITVSDYSIALALVCFLRGV